MLTYVLFGVSFTASLAVLWPGLKWRHRALVAERDLAELRAEIRHQSHVQDARRRLIGELVDARARRN